MFWPLDKGYLIVIFFVVPCFGQVVHEPAIGLMLHGTCDNNMKIFADTSLLITNNDWTETSEVQIPENTNSIEIHCYDAGVVGGILASFDNGLKTNGTWSCSADGGSTWNSAYEIGPNGMSPWGVRPQISTGAKWIWTGKDNYHGKHKNVICKISLGLEAPNGYTVKKGDCPGNDIWELYRAESSLAECSQLCNSSPQCQAFMLFNHKTCFPKTKSCVAPTQEGPFNVFYSKTGPDVPSLLPHYVRENAGAEIELQCIPTDPSSQITGWFRNGFKYEPTDNSNIIITKRTQPGERSYLNILRARLGDSANFTCVANNNAGSTQSRSSEIIIYDLEKINLITCNLKALITPSDETKEANISYKHHEDQAILNFVMNFSKSSSINAKQIERLKINEIILIEKTMHTNYISCNENDETCFITLPILLNANKIEIELLLNEFEKCKQESIPIEDIRKDVVDWLKYSAWTEWSGCSVECGEGIESRNRDCRLGQENFCKYKEKLIEMKKCTGKNGECQGMYMHWGDWGACNITCIRTKNQPGQKNRTRECDVGSNCDDAGKMEIRNCFGELDFHFCPLDCYLETKHQRSEITKTRYDLTVDITKPKDKDDPAKKQNLLLRKSGSNTVAAEIKWDMSDAKTCEGGKPLDSNIINYNCSLDKQNNCICRFHDLKMRTSYSLTRIIYEKTNSDVLDPRYCLDKLDEEYHWQCDNKETIFFSQLCDNNIDCTDGSDEEDALCKGTSLLLHNIGLSLTIILIIDIIVVCILIKFFFQLKNPHKEDQFVSSTIGKDFFENIYKNAKEEREARKIIRNMGSKDIEQIIKISSTMDFYLHRKVLNVIKKEFAEKKLLQFLYASMENRSKLKLAFDIVRPGVTDKMTHSIKLKIPVSQMAVITHVTEVTSAASFAFTPFYDFFKDSSIITILFYFSDEILQNDFARIGFLRLDHVVYLLIGVLSLTVILRTLVEISKFPDKVINMNRWLKILILIPGFYPTLHAAVCMSLSWNITSSKLKLAKMSEDAWDDETWNAKLKEIQMIYTLDEKMSVMKNESRFGQGCENVLENFIQAIVMTILVLRGKLFNFFQSTITKNLPFIFPLLIICSFLSLVLKARSYKSGFKQGFLSLGGIAQTLAICCSILQKTLLYILASYQYTFIAVVMMGLVTCIIFVFNNIYNTMFASSTLVDRIAYSLVSTMIPITFTDWKMVKNSEKDEKAETNRKVSYGQKRTFSQGFFIHLVHWMESALLIGIIYAQQNLDDTYEFSLKVLFEEKEVKLAVPFPVALAMISASCHILGGLLNFTYYRIVHPWSAITQKYSMCDHFSIYPEISVYNQTFHFHPDENDEVPKQVTLMSLRLPKSFKSKRKPKNVDLDDLQPTDKVEVGISTF